MNRFEQAPNLAEEKRWLEQKLAQVEARLVKATDMHDRDNLQDDKRRLLGQIEEADRRMAA